MTYVLFGQMSDPNIAAVRGHFDVLIDQSDDLSWDINQNQLIWGGEPVNMTGFFGRANVFEENTEQKRANWHLMVNFLDINSHISRYNRRYKRETPVKAANLHRARSVGLKIPQTIIGKGPMEGDCIVKPLTGGAHCLSGNEAHWTGIIQERIRGTNRRLFIVGEQHFGFRLETTELDYREDPFVELYVEHFDDDTVDKVRAVGRDLGLTFLAADFMDDVFLEVNSGPMFSAFNGVVNGAIASAIRAGL